MTTRYVDSFDDYTTLSQRYSVSAGIGGTATIGAGAKRTGANGLAIVGPNTSNASFINPNYLPTAHQYYFGFAFQPTALPASTNANGICPIASTRDAATTQGTLGVNTAGQLVLCRGTCAGTVVAVSAKVVRLNVWYYVEFRHLCDIGGGILEVRVNGEVWATFLGNTRVSGFNQITFMGFGGTSSVNAGKVNFNADDVYCNDDAGGAPNNTYWGDTQIEGRVPTGAGFYTEFANLVGAATHWQAVSEIPPDEDASYIGSNVVNQRDTFAHAALAPTNATINALQVNTRARLDAATGESFARMYRRGGADNQGADVGLLNAYAYYIEVIEQDPLAGPGAWTRANVNAGEFGARVR